MKGVKLLVFYHVLALGVVLKVEKGKSQMSETWFLRFGRMTMTDAWAQEQTQTVHSMGNVGEASRLAL